MAKTLPHNLLEIRRDWVVLSAYERFEAFVPPILTLLITGVILVALWRLRYGVVDTLVLRSLDPLEHGVFQTVFGEIDRGGPDGIRCDSEGRLWSSSGDGVQVFAVDGTRLARVRLPKGGANLCFGGPQGRTLFVTARDGVYAVETNTRDASAR